MLKGDKAAFASGDNLPTASHQPARSRIFKPCAVETDPHEKQQEIVVGLGDSKSAYITIPTGMVSWEGSPKAGSPKRGSIPFLVSDLKKEAERQTKRPTN
jgi:hypothetical protein